MALGALDLLLCRGFKKKKKSQYLPFGHGKVNTSYQYIGFNIIMAIQGNQHWNMNSSSRTHQTKTSQQNNYECVDNKMENSYWTAVRKNLMTRRLGSFRSCSAYLVQQLQGGEVVDLFRLRRHLHVASSFRVDALMP